MPRSRYQQRDAARKRWQGDNPVKGGRRRPIAYRVMLNVLTGLGAFAFDYHPVEGSDSKSLQRAYRRAKRQADNINGIVKAVYEL